MVFVAFPLEAATTPQDVKLLYQKVDELIQKHIHIVTAPQASNEDNTANSISFVLLVIKTLTEVQKNIVDPNFLVRILQRLARDMGSSAGSHPRPVCPYFLIISLFFSFVNPVFNGEVKFFANVSGMGLVGLQTCPNPNRMALCV